MKKKMKIRVGKYNRKIYYTFHPHGNVPCKIADVKWIFIFYSKTNIK